MLIVTPNGDLINFDNVSEVTFANGKTTIWTNSSASGRCDVEGDHRKYLAEVYARSDTTKVVKL